MKPKTSDSDRIAKQLKEDPVLRDELRRKGVKVRLDGSAVRKTFRVDKQILKRFLDLADERGLKVREATDQALADWIKKHDG